MVWPRILNDEQFGKEVFEAVTKPGSGSGMSVLSHLSEDQTAELYIWLTKTYPDEENPDEIAWGNSRGFASEWRNAILGRLQSWGTGAACEAIQNLMRSIRNSDT